MPATPQPDPTSRRFPRDARLRRGDEFLAVRATGETLQGRYLRITVLRIPSQRTITRLGIITSRRAGSAVERNRMRRRVREFFRSDRHSLIDGSWIVVVVKHGASAATFSDVREEWLRLLRRLSMVRASE